MAERQIKVQVIEVLKGGVKRITNLELPERTGDEGFDFLDALHEKTACGAVPDPARTKRWLDVMAQRKKDGFG